MPWVLSPALHQTQWSITNTSYLTRSTMGSKASHTLVWQYGILYHLIMKQIEFYRFHIEVHSLMYLHIESFSTCRLRENCM